MEIRAVHTLASSEPAPLHPGQWFERTFDFEHLSVSPAGLIERLRYTPLRLAEQTRQLSAEQRTAKPEGQWSVQENVGHLLDLEPLWLGRVQDTLAGQTNMRPADLQNRKTHEANHNTASLQELLGAFAAERQKLVRLCEANHPVLSTAWALHPRLQTPMRIIDLMYFVAEHDDHHIATIRYLLSRLAQGS